MLDLDLNSVDSVLDSMVDFDLISVASMVDIQSNLALRLVGLQPVLPDVPN